MFKMNKLFKKTNYEKKHQINKNLNRKKTIPWSIYLFKKINYEKKHQINKNLNRKKTIPWSIYLFKN